MFYFNKIQPVVLWYLMLFLCVFSDCVNVL